MVNYGDNRFADCHDFLVYLYTITRRAQTARNSNYTFKYNTRCKEELTRIIKDEGSFLDRLKAARKNPDSATAKIIMRQLLPILEAGGKNLDYTPGNNKDALVKLIALNRVFGNGSLFVTINSAIIRQSWLYKLGDEYI
jgi:hypothetical protein